MPMENCFLTSLLTKAQTGLVLPQEAGLTGIAFHPDFNHIGTFGYGKFYTITTEASENNGGLPDASVDFPFHNGTNNEEHQDVVREWDLSAFGNVPGNCGQQPIHWINERQLAGNPSCRPTGSVS